MSDTASNALWYTIMPHHSRDECGVVGEALFTLSEWIQNHAPTATKHVDTTVVTMVQTLTDDGARLPEALQGEIWTKLQGALRKM